MVFREPPPPDPLKVGFFSETLVHTMIIDHVLVFSLLTFTPFSCISIVDFEQVNVSSEKHASREVLSL